MSSPVITHPVCDLNMRQRHREARVDALARSVSRANGHPSLLDRLLGRRHQKGARLAADIFDLRDPGEDVWQALRF